MFHALHAFSRHPALFPLANALIPSMSQTPTRYAKNAAVSAVNAPGPMYLAPSALGQLHVERVQHLERSIDLGHGQGLQLSSLVSR